MTVTQFVKSYKQPKSGFVPLDLFDLEVYDSNVELYDQKLENIPPYTIGLVVDYVSRYILLSLFYDEDDDDYESKKQAFIFSLWGAHNDNKLDRAKYLLNNIKGADDESIINAIKLVGYDQCYRAGVVNHQENQTIPNNETIHNIRQMISRTVLFFKEKDFKNCTLFFDGALNDIITNGDADFMTKSTLWDLKVSKYEPKKEDTFQVLIYYLLSKKTKNIEEIELYKSFNSIGIFNPRLNKAWTFKVDLIPKELINGIYRLIGF